MPSKILLLQFSFIVLNKMLKLGPIGEFHLNKEAFAVTSNILLSVLTF